MKAKVTRGDGFAGCLAYVIGKDTAEVIGGTVVGTDAAEMARTYRASCQDRRKEVKKPVWHSSLTLPAGESLSVDKWLEVAASYMDKLGMSEDRAYSIIRHSDTEHDHVHIVASRVGLDASLWSNSQDVYKAIAATQELEKEHGLTQTKGYTGEKKAERYQSQNETERTLRTGDPTAKTVIKNAVNAVLKKPCSWKNFELALSLQGVTPMLHEQSTGRIGVSYETAGVTVKGSKLGKAYSLGGLAKRGLEYGEQDRAGERDRQEGSRPETGAYRSPRGLGAGDAAVTQRDTASLDAYVRATLDAIAPRGGNRLSQKEDRPDAARAGGDQTRTRSDPRRARSDPKKTSRDRSEVGNLFERNNISRKGASLRYLKAASSLADFIGCSHGGKDMGKEKNRSNRRSKKKDLDYEMEL